MPSDPVLLLHGQPGGARDWERVKSLIEDRVSVIAIDRPGWDRQTPPADLRGNGLAAVGALDAQGIERATLVGHSLGAAVCAWMAVVHPERVSALVLVAPAANRASLYQLDYVLARPVAGYLVSVAAFGGIGLALTAARLRRRLARSLALDDGYLRDAGRLLLAPSAWHAFVRDQQMLVREMPSVEQRLGDISAPTSVVIGSADRVIPVSSARLLVDQIPAAQLVVFERAGHLIPQREPERLAELIVATAR